MSTDATEQKSEPAADAAKPTDGSKAAHLLKHPGLRVLVAVLGVFGVVASLFAWRQAQKAEELGAQYARAVTHMGRQVELEFESYENVVKNLSPVANQAPDASPAVVAALAAKNRLDGATRALQAAAARLAEANLVAKAIDSSNSLLKSYRSRPEARFRWGRTAPGPDQELAERFRNIASDVELIGKQAEAAKTQALAARDLASLAEKTAKAAEEAARYARVAEELASSGLESEDLDQRLVDAVVRAEKAARNAMGKVAPREQAGERAGADQATAPEAGNARESVLVAQARRAAQLAKRSSIEFALAAKESQELAFKAMVSLGLDRSRLLDGIDKLDWRSPGVDREKQAEVESFLVLLQRAVRSASESDAVEPETGADDALRGRDSAKSRQALDAALIESTEQDDAAAVALTGFLRNALPSYENQIRLCFQQISNVGRWRCVVQALARMSDIPPGDLRFEDCPEYVDERQPSAWIDTTRQQLLFPIGADSLHHGGCALVPVSRMVPAAPRSGEFSRAPRTGQFEETLLMDRAGVVLSNDPDSPIRLEALAELAESAAVKSTVLDNVELSGVKYRVFLQPVRVSVAPRCSSDKSCTEGQTKRAKAVRGSRTGMVVAGLVREDRLFSESLQVDPSSLLWVALLLAFSILSVPLAKLWLLGRWSVFGRFDAALLGTAAVLTTLIVAVSVWASYAHDNLDRRVDDQLKGVTEQIQKELAKQLEPTRKALEDFANATVALRMAHPSYPGWQATTQGRGSFAEVCSSAQTSADSKSGLRDDARASDTASGVAQWHFEGTSTPESVCEVTDYAPSYLASLGGDWDQAIWLTLAGRQAIKFARGAHATRPLTLANRGYFREALVKQTGCEDPKDPSAPARCQTSDSFVEVIRSRNTGEMLLTVSTPTRNASGKVNGVAMISRTISRLMAAVLPRGFQLAITDGKGRVMLHSEPSNHGHNLLDDVGDPAALGAVLNARVDDLLDTSYLGSRNRMHVHHVDGLDWFVVAIAPRTLVDEPTTDIVIVTIGGCVLLLIVALLIVAIIAFVYWVKRLGAKHTEALHSAVLLKPDARRTRDYVNWGFGCLGVGVVLCATAAWVPRWPIVFPLLATLVCAAMALWFGAVRCRTPGAAPVAAGSRKRASKKPAQKSKPLQAKPRGWLRLSHWRLTQSTAAVYCVWLLGLVATLIFTPATLFFVGGYEHVIDNVVRAEQVHYERKLERAPHCLWLFADPEKRSENAKGEEEPSKECHYVIPNVKTLAVRTRKMSVNDERWTEILALGWWWPFPAVMPWFPALGSAEFADGLFYRAEPGWKRTASEVSRVATIDEKQSRLVSTIPPLFTWKHRESSTICLVSAFLLFSLLAFWLSIWCVRRLVFTEVLDKWRRHDPVSKKDLLASLDSQRSLLVLHAPATLRAEVRDSLQFTNWSQADVDGAEGQNIFFDDLIADLRSHARKRVLAVLSKPGHRFVAFAPVHPLDMDWQDDEEEVADALSSFDEVRCRPEVHPQLRPSPVDPTSQKASPGSAKSNHPNKIELVRLWNACSPEEQNVLGQLANNGFATPHPSLTPILEHLVARGMLNRCTLTIPNGRLEEFVRERVSPADLAKLELSTGRSTWDSLKVPLSTAVVLLCGVFGLSDPELAVTGVIAPAFAAGLPGLVRLVAAVIGTAALAPGSR